MSVRPGTNVAAGIPVVPEGPEFAETAAKAARDTGGFLCASPPGENVPYLSAGPGGLSLRAGGLSLRGDLSSVARRLAAGNLGGELLVRAARPASRRRGATAADRSGCVPADVRSACASEEDRSACASEGEAEGAELRAGANARRRPLVIDATAGLGEDSFLLAAAGFFVDMYEHNPVIAALLSDALGRAMEDPGLRGPASRMRLTVGDSLDAIKNADPAPDVIYLDPMFPERRKSAAVKKKFQLLHMIEEPEGSGEALLAAAIAAAPGKIVIKRPPKGPCLGGIRPGYSLTGKAVRYDVIVPAGAAPRAAEER